MGSRKNKNRFILLLIVIAAIIAFRHCSNDKIGNYVSDPEDQVSTLVGTLSDFSYSNGNTYPAVGYPWGMNLWTPQTGKAGDGWAYKYTDKIIRGFKQTHQPSPWINDYGQMAIMPVNGYLVDEDSRYSWFSHKTETAKPYHYGVYLSDHDIHAQMTTSERAAAMNFRFPESDRSSIVIDGFNDGSFLTVRDARTIEGFSRKNSGGVPENFYNYFVIRFDKEIENYGFADDEVITYRAGVPVSIGGNEKTDHAQLRVGFRTVKGEEVNLQIATSFISTEQARENLKEIEHLSFDEVKEKSRSRWNEILGRIEISGGSEREIRTFYSCLYRSVLFPLKAYEIDKEGQIIHYSPYNGKIEKGYLYTGTGFWDTFRALFPLLNLVYPDINREIQAGLANTYRESGFLPEWASPGHRGCMIGNNSASVVSDAIVKGITPEEDIETLYQAMMHGRSHVHPEISSTGRLGHEYYDSLGYVPYNCGIAENVARTLEYAYDDWCILQAAEHLGKDSDTAMLAKAAMNYRNVFDREHHLMRGRMTDGSFQSPFNPYKWGDAFTEGNSWHYTWSVFHDMEGLADMMEGDFRQMLDSVFTVPPVYDASYYGFRIHEITEMQTAGMGNYAHGNQPAQHMVYLYNYTDQPWKTQALVRDIMNRLYTPDPDGYCGDEDNGQTSAWYVFSAMGFYPVCPVSDEYAMGTPLFRKMKIHLQNGKTVEIINRNNQYPYIEKVTVNGKGLHHNFMTWSRLHDGVSIVFKTAPEPNTKRGIKEKTRPYSFSKDR